MALHKCQMNDQQPFGKVSVSVIPKSSVVVLISVSFLLDQLSFCQLHVKTPIYIHTFSWPE